MNERASNPPVSKEGSVKPDGAGCIWILVGLQFLILLGGALVEWRGWLDAETWVVWSNAGLMLLLVLLWLASSVSKGMSPDESSPSAPPPVASQGQSEGSSAPPVASQGQSEGT